MSLSQTTTSKQADKRYIYRHYSWTVIVFLLLVYGICILVFGWLAITNNQPWLWFGTLFFLIAFSFFCRIALLETRNKFVITVSHTGIYLPAIWKRGATVYLPFSSLSAIELIKLRRDTILKLSAGKELRIISEACFPQSKDFKELIGIVQKQSPIPFSEGSL